MIGIIDYGLGNYKAFENVLNDASKKFTYVKEEDDLSKINCAILPGVGSFDNAIKKFREQSYFTTLNNLVISSKLPILGVCVGMQIMTYSSDEGFETGLKWIEGSVKKFNNVTVPHLGWNKINIINKNEIIFKNLSNNSEFYFLHSYFVDVEDQYVKATTKYGKSFCSIFQKNHIYGVQFHPEKSHDNGKEIILNFCDKYA